jgi:hypothetical protein
MTDELYMMLKDRLFKHLTEQSGENYETSQSVALQWVLGPRLEPRTS